MRANFFQLNRSGLAFQRFPPIPLMLHDPALCCIAKRTENGPIFQRSTAKYGLKIGPNRTQSDQKTPPPASQPSSKAKFVASAQDGGKNPSWDMDEPMELPIDGVLDLHTFKPSDVKDLVPEYLAACHEKGIFQVRIIHGKGTGILRARVHSILAKHPLVSAFSLDHPEYGGWGATIVQLKKS